MIESPLSTSRSWPELCYENWRDTAGTLHMWTQIIGKIRLVQSPWLNHSWHVTLYVTPRGLTTGNIPHGLRTFSIDFDFVDHCLILRASDGALTHLPLRPQDTADFYRAVMSALDDMGCPVEINTTPNEVEDPVPFEDDRVHNAYDADAANHFWQALTHIDRVFNAFRASFAGKSSPVHFFWGSFDLAVTRFSGREAPDHPGGLPNMPLWVAQEAYSHEVSSVGFWPGGDNYPEAIFYAYAYPSPAGFDAAKVEPEAASWSSDLGEFVLPYEAVRNAEFPDGALRAFLDSTFIASAELCDWDLEVYKRRHFPKQKVEDAK